jgi:hypothetical protein
MSLIEKFGLTTKTHVTYKITEELKLSLQVHMSAIQQLSDNDKPAYFGLPVNVERSWQRITSHEVINRLKSKFARSVDHESIIQYVQCSGFLFRSIPCSKYR